MPLACVFQLLSSSLYGPFWAAESFFSQAGQWWQPCWFATNQWAQPQQQRIFHSGALYAHDGHGGVTHSGRDGEWWGLNIKDFFGRLDSHEFQQGPWCCEICYFAPMMPLRNGFSEDEIISYWKACNPFLLILNAPPIHPLLLNTAGSF